MADRRRLPALDTLRALAILWVYLFHARDVLGLAADEPWSAIASFGNAGVDLFFVLSGYLIGRIVLAELAADGTLGLRRFWYRRWMRTLPAYYATLALLALVPAASPLPWHPRDLPAFLAFVQNYSADWPRVRFSWSWSLCVEEWFYLGLPLLVLGLRRLRPGTTAAGTLRAIGLGAIALAVGGRALLFARAHLGYVPWSVAGYQMYAQTHARLDGLGVGLLLATMPPCRSPRLAALAAGAGSLVVLGLLALGDPGVIGRNQRPLALALAFGGWVYVSAGEVRWARLAVPGARWLAELSYAVYLSHYVAFDLVAARIGPDRPLARLAAATAATLGASLLIRHGVERPALRLRDRRPAT